MIASPNQTYVSLESAYVFFNQELFGDLLPPCLITMQRHKGSYGYFCGGRFGKHGKPEELADEIALNPVHFANRTTTKTLSVLVHEMAHLWQFHFGKPSRGRYHNREWAEKMRDLGLIPSDTGSPGGHETGQRMSHYIQEGGPFDLSCTAYLVDSDTVLYQDRAGEKKRSTKATSKTKYSCPQCEQNAWAKPDASLVCGHRRVYMIAKIEF